MDRWVTPHKRVTSSTWGPPPPYKQVLIFPIQTTWYSPTSFPGLFPLKLGGAGLGFPPLPISMGKALGTRLDILQAIAYAYICTWMHVHKTTFERNSSPGYHHVIWKGKKTYKLKRFFFLLEKWFCKILLANQGALWSRWKWWIVKWMFKTF